MIRTRTWGALVSAVVIAAVAEPLLRHPSEDGFPLSTFPMFSEHKSPRATIHHVVGFSNEGRHRVIPPRALGTNEIMQAAALAERASRDGERARALCAEVAVAVAGDPEFDDITQLEVRSDRFDGVRYFEGDRRPERTLVWHRCDVPGRRSP